MATGTLDSNVSEGFVPNHGQPIGLDSTGGVVSWCLGPHDKGSLPATYPDSTLYHLRGVANAQPCAVDADCQSGHCRANACAAAGKGDWCTPSSGKFGGATVCAAGLSCQQFSSASDGYDWICV
jgi:hypothetical protein